MWKLKNIFSDINIVEKYLWRNSFLRNFTLTIKKLSNFTVMTTFMILTANLEVH